MLEMINALISGLFQCFTWSTFSLMCIGIAIGFVVGILPGLGGPTAMALMLPFIFKMSAVEAFAFLLGMTAVTATTGDITSVLFGVPGEPTTASTIVDGHAMARNGEAGRALGAVLMSSLVGAVFGAVAIAVAIPIIRPIVLSFGSPEFFMLSLLGITFVAALSGEDVLKGMVAGGIGLMLATIGLDPISGIQRYTFNQLFLWDGIGLVPITIGFYAIPETIELAVLGTSIATQEVEKLGGVMEGVKDTFRHWWLVIRCSALGTFMAIIPGMGAATTQWLAYAHAVQSLKDRSRAGKGAVEGVLGPGAANNSTLGGSLITTIAFGGTPGKDNPSTWRYHYSHHPCVDLLRRLCGKERFRRYARRPILRWSRLGHGEIGVAAPARSTGSRSRPAGREQALSLHRQLWSCLAWASRRDDNFCRHPIRCLLSNDQK